jgi:hypothetical protein
MPVPPRPEDVQITANLFTVKKPFTKNQFGQAKIKAIQAQPTLSAIVQDRGSLSNRRRRPD